MAALHGHTHGRGSNGNGFVAKYLPGFVHHLHFFLRVAVFKERIDVRKDVLVDGIGIHGRVLAPFAAVPLGVHLVDGLVARARDALICRNHYTLDSQLFMYRGKGKHHLDCGTVGIGYDIVVGAEHIAVDFRNDQLLARVHPPV